MVEASEDDDFVAVVDGLMIGSTLGNSSVGGYAVDLINRALNLEYLGFLHVDQIHGVQEAAVIKASEDVDVVAYHIFSNVVAVTGTPWLRTFAKERWNHFR